MPRITFDVMPDVPEERRGLHYWANPNWLCLAKRAQEEPKTYAKNSEVMKKNRVGSKPISIIDSDGVRHNFDSRNKAVLWIGYADKNSVGLFNAIRKGEKLENGDVRVICFEREYIVIKGGEV